MKLNFDLRLTIAIIVAVSAIALAFYLIFIPKGPYATDMDRAVYRCVFLCKASGDQGLSLEDGPCLSAGSPEWDIPDWVCDVAHSPREESDNLPQNQCPGYGSSANHFVEVSPDCVFIRAI